MIEAYARSKEPFLLSLHFTAPHWPWEGARRRSRVRGGSGTSYIATAARRGPTQRWSQSLDANIGRVMQVLDVSGLTGNTIVVFTSDNGGERFSNMWPFSGMKQELLEGGLRIPAIARWPGRIAAGSVSDQVMVNDGLAADTCWLPPAPLQTQHIHPTAKTWGPIMISRAPAPPAQALLAIQGRCAARCPRRQLEVPADRRQ